MSYEDNARDEQEAPAPEPENVPVESPTTEETTGEPESETPTVGEDLAAVEDAAVAESEPVPEHWRLESWSGLPKWQCNHCGFSTMRGEEDMMEHVQGRHLALARVKGASGLVGPNGDAL